MIAARFSLLACGLVFEAVLLSIGLVFAEMPQPVTSHPAVDFAPSVSSDGRVIAFVSDRAGNQDIWLRTVTGRSIVRPRQITTHPATDAQPATNADGSRLLYVSQKTDPRGDVFLVNLKSGKEVRLTDLSSADSWPAWGPDGKTVLYLAMDYTSGVQRIVERELDSDAETVLVSGATSFSISPGGWISYSDGDDIRVFQRDTPAAVIVVSTGASMDLWPAASRDGTHVYFARYARDTNGDGFVDADDQSSIWMHRVDPVTRSVVSRYRMTPDGHFHLHTAEHQGTVFFSDLQGGDIWRVGINEFVEHYATLSNAQSLADRYLAGGHDSRARLVLGNISRNMTRSLPAETRAAIDVEYAGMLTSAGQFDQALAVLDVYRNADPTLNALATIYSEPIRAYQHTKTLSPPARARVIRASAERILALGQEYRGDDVVYGTSLIEAGRLFLSIDDTLSALNALVKVDVLQSAEVRAKALFRRAEVYSALGDQSSLTAVYVDVLTAFGEDSTWGRRAIRKAIDAAQAASMVHENIEALRALAQTYSDVEGLAASALFRVSDLYVRQREPVKAVDVLDTVIDRYHQDFRLLEASHRRKAAIFTATNNPEQAEKAYAKVLVLAEANGVPDDELHEVERRLVLERVRRAIRVRDRGEPRVAVKMLHGLIQQYPDSVEAHRGYIETKVILGQTQDVQMRYRQRVARDGTHAASLYGHGLAQTYATPPDFPAMIDVLERAVGMDEGVSYFYQTLGWAYEQYEQFGEGESGFLEKAIDAYRVALELNDIQDHSDVEANLLLNLGNAYVGLGNFSEALRHYHARDQFEHPDGDLHTELLYRKRYGQAAFKSRDTDAAIAQYHKALNLATQQAESDSTGVTGEILERLALAYQEAGQHAKAIRYFSEALDVSHATGRTEHLGLLQRNIGVNLYNLSVGSQDADRDALKRALKSYFSSLDAIKNTGVKEQTRRPGLFHLDVGLGAGSSDAATGFDRRGEEKLLFSYIASTYEALDQPSSAMEYHLKKLGMLSEDDAPESGVAGAIEKAVLFNRMGVLSYRMGAVPEALNYMRDSLKYTQQLNVKFGTRVNAANVARLAWETMLTGSPVARPLVESLVATMDVELSGESSDLHAALALAHVAFVLYALPESPSMPPGSSVEEISRAHHAWYRYKSRVYPYLLAAHRVIDATSDLPIPEKVAHLVTLKLNLIHLAEHSGKSGVAHGLREELHELVAAQGHTQRWLVELAQVVEHGDDSRERHRVLEQAFQSALATPPQLALRGRAKHMAVLYDRLSQGYVDSLIAQGDIVGAFAAAERLAMRTITMHLYDALGERFFVDGIGPYQEEIIAIFEDMRLARDAGQQERLTELLGQFEALIVALRDEYPWAVSFFYEYPPHDDLMGTVVTPERPYLKLVHGAQTRHLFIHDGRSLNYLEVSPDATTLPPALVDALSSSTGVYLSGMDEQGLFATERFPALPMTRVNTIYDLVNAQHRRGLFYNTIVVAGEFDLPKTLTAEMGDVTLLRLQGNADEDRQRFENAETFVASEEMSTFAFSAGQELGVQNWIHLTDIPSGYRHSAILLNGTDVGKDGCVPVVSGLIRQGFPHVLVNVTDDRVAADEDVVGLYLSLLDDLPSDEALAVARSEVRGGETSTGGLVLYGYAGMNEEERSEFVRTVYDTEAGAAVAAYRDGDIEQALRGFDKALSVIHEAGNMSDFAQLTTLAVESAFQLKHYDAAARYQERLVAYLDGIGAEDSLPDALYQLGIVNSRREHYGPAVQQLSAAIEIWERTEELDRLAEGLSTRGVILENRGDYVGALSDFGTSFRLFEELGEVADMASQYRKIGRIHYLRLGRYAQARENFESALEWYRSIGNRRGEAETLLEVGLTFEKIGLFDRADEQYRAAQRIAEDLMDAALVATSELYLGNTAWFQGNYQEAFQQLSLAYEVASASDDTQLPIMIENTKGLIFWTLNETDKGLRHLHRALEMAEREDIPTEIASSLNNLGLVYRQQGNLLKSLTFFERAKMIDERLNSRWGLGYDHRNIGISKLKLGQLQDAERHFLLAEEHSAAIKNVVNQAKALLELGNVNRAMQNDEKAATYYDRAYRLATTYGIKEVQWQAAEGTAAIKWRDGSYDAAVRWYSDAVTIVEGMRAELKIDSLRNSYHVNKQDLYRDLITLLVERGNTEDAFNYLERSRARSFIDLLGNQKLTLKHPDDEQRIGHLSDLHRRMEAIGVEIASFETPPDALIRQYDDTKHAYDEALLDLQRRNPQLSSFVAVDPLTQKDFERLLDPGVGVLSYMLGKQAVFIWLVRDHGTAFFRVDVDADSTVDLVERYRSLIQKLEPVDTVLGRLYDRLVAPAEAQLAGVRYLGIIPDGALHFLSFSALKSADGFLVDRFPLFYAPSASVLKYTFGKRRATKLTKVLALGNPDLGNYNYDLPLAELEVESMRWSFPDVDLHVGGEAKRAWLVENVAHYGVIHLATHGEFNDFNPLFSSLLLSAPSLDEGRLSVKDVFSLNINADIVTLSACQTGLGELHGGEIIGLNRAFLYAGTHALISSLWRVDDLSTSVLMKHFYRRYASMDKATSLQQAQREVKASFPHPSYWAGLSLVGDYR